MATLKQDASVVLYCLFGGLFQVLELLIILSELMLRDHMINT
jgi:hypothetical protein